MEYRNPLRHYLREVVSRHTIATSRAHAWTLTTNHCFFSSSSVGDCLVCFTDTVLLHYKSPQNESIGT